MLDVIFGSTDWWRFSGVYDRDDGDKIWGSESSRCIEKFGLVSRAPCRPRCNREAAERREKKRREMAAKLESLRKRHGADKERARRTYMEAKR